MNHEVSLSVAAEDPVAAALNDPITRLRMENAACAFLRRQGSKLSYLQRKEDAKVLAQEAAIRAWTLRERYDSERKVMNWLIGIVNNVVREHLKKSRRDAVAHARDVAGLDQWAIDPARPIADILGDRQWLDHLLSKLTLREQTILRLKECEEMTCAEIGLQLGMKESAVRTAAFRALRALQRCSAAEEGRP